MKNKPVTPFESGELRRKAEATLNERRQQNALPPLTEADNQRLVYELQVHQIELEMQNEELGQSRAEVEVLLQKYTDLYDFAPMGYFTLSGEGTIQRVNLAGATLLGVADGGLNGQGFEAFVLAKSQATFRDFLNKVFRGKHKEVCEVELQKDGPTALFAYIEATLEDGQEALCRLVVVDITLRKQAEEQLRYLGTHDALTGLYNRSFFMEELAGMKEELDFPVSVIMASGDQLRDINDVYGYTTGDVLLKHAAEILRLTFRTTDRIARLSGQVFAVLMPETQATEAEVLMEQFQQAIQKSNAGHFEIPIHLLTNINTAKTAASLGVILHETDIHMYREERGQNAQ